MIKFIFFILKTILTCAYQKRSTILSQARVHCSIWNLVTFFWELKIYRKLKTTTVISTLSVEIKHPIIRSKNCLEQKKKKKRKEKKHSSFFFFFEYCESVMRWGYFCLQLLVWLYLLFFFKYALFKHHVYLYGWTYIFYVFKSMLGKICSSDVWCTGLQAARLMVGLMVESTWEDVEPPTFSFALSENLIVFLIDILKYLATLFTICF